MARIFFTQQQAPQIGDLEFELITSEAHTRSSQAPTYPVERSNEISDHIVNDPETLSIEGFITETPVTDEPEPRVVDAYDLLTDMVDAKELVDVVTGLEVYTDMHIARISFPRDGRTGDSLRFSAELRKVRRVRSREIEVNIEQLGGDDITREQSQPESDRGRVSPNEAEGLAI